MKKELPTRPQSVDHLPASHFEEFDRSTMTCQEVVENLNDLQIDEALKQGFTFRTRGRGNVTMSRTVRFTM